MVGSKTRYAKAKEIVTAAMAVEPAARPDFLRQRCGDDLELKREVDWLIEAMDAKDAFLEVAPVSGHEPGDDAVMQVRAPRDYRILRRIGEGGHGVVFLAERTDGKYVQLVALKLLNFAGHLSPIVTARFDLERQILARLTHPNIAQLMDGGTLKNGHPFLAMEYVDGSRIDEYCRNHQLGIEDRLRLFLKVGAAVAYAHQQLVIHRDLKPANVLVTEQGEPKLLDFGVARLMSAADDPASPPTQDAGRLLTLLYASPEQIRGEPLSTTSDVYSLGVLLYELLTGVPPFVDDAEHVHRLTRDICETEPTKPSRRVMTGGTGGSSTERTGSGWWQRYAVTMRPISADLDAIVLKSLRKRPEERYPSVQALMDDIQHYLEDRPVAARRGHAWYRVRRFMRRHRWAVAAATVFVALLAGFGIDRQLQLDRVKVERATAEQVTAFMVDGFKVLDPVTAKGRTITAQQVLDNATLKIGRLSDRPEVQGKLLDAMADAYLQIGQYGQSVDLSRRAVVTWHRMGPRYRTNLVRSLNAQGSGLILMKQDTEADAVADAALAVLAQERISSGKPLAVALSIKASTASRDPKRVGQADHYFQQAITAVKDNPAALAELRLRYARIMLYVRREESRKQLALAQPYLQSLPEDHPLRLEALGMLVDITGVGGDFARGAALAKQQLDLVKRIYGTANANYAARADTLSAYLARIGKADQAETYARESVSYFQAAGPGYADDLHRSQHNLETALIVMDRFDEAEPLVLKNMALVRTAFGQNDVRYAGEIFLYAFIKKERGDLVGAAAAFEQAISIYRIYGTRRRDSIAAAEWNLAFIFNQLQRYPEALQHARAAADLYSAEYGPDSVQIAWSRLYGGIAMVGIGDVTNGNRAVQQSYAAAIAKLDHCDSDIADEYAAITQLQTQLPRLVLPPKPVPCPIPNLASARK